MKGSGYLKCFLILCWLKSLLRHQPCISGMFMSKGNHGKPQTVLCYAVVSPDCQKMKLYHIFPSAIIRYPILACWGTRNDNCLNKIELARSFHGNSWYTSVLNSRIKMHSWIAMQWAEWSKGSRQAATVSYTSSSIKQDTPPPINQAVFTVIWPSTSSRFFT